MHYAKNTFSKGTYLETILPVDIPGRKRPEIGQRIRLSEGDIAQANLLYKCPSEFRRNANAQNSVLTENVSVECGRTFQDNSGSFTSPSYYIATNEPEKCEWRITATHGERILLNITDLVRLFFEQKLFVLIIFFFRTFSNPTTADPTIWRFATATGTSRRFSAVSVEVERSTS